MFTLPVELTPKQHKALQIMNTVVNSAFDVIAIMEGYPNTGKHRNIFRKTYNRRPRNKQKRIANTVRLGTATLHYAWELQRQISTPLPVKTTINLSYEPSTT